MKAALINVFVLAMGHTAYVQREKDSLVMTRSQAPIAKRRHVTRDMTPDERSCCPVSAGCVNRLMESNLTSDNMSVLC